MKFIESKKGAAAVVASIIVAAIALSIILSITLVGMYNRASVNSFYKSVQGFYAAESGVGEALMQLRKEPDNFVFDKFYLADIPVTSEFVEETGGVCEPTPECAYPPGSGWWGEYFNLSVTHPDMEVNPLPGPTPTPTEHDWFDDTYKTHEQIDADLELPTSQWFPYDGTPYENKEGYAHDYHFTMHWRAKVTAPAAGNYSYDLRSDDDSWVILNGIVIVNNSGTHAAFSKTGDIYLAQGDSIIELYFAERHTVESGFSFKFNDTSLIFTPWPEGCGDNLVCNSNIESTATSTAASRKVRYSCNQEIDNCYWSELTP